MCCDNLSWCLLSHRCVPGMQCVCICVYTKLSHSVCVLQLDAFTPTSATFSLFQTPPGRADVFSNLLGEWKAPF